MQALHIQSENTGLFIEPGMFLLVSRCFSFNTSLAFSFLGFFSSPSLEKRPERRNSFFCSVIQWHRVNASILFLTTSVNCRSYSPTRTPYFSWKARLRYWDWSGMRSTAEDAAAGPFLIPSPLLVFVLNHQYELTHVHWDTQWHTNKTCKKTKTFNKHW